MEHLSRNLNDWEVGEMANLMVIVDGYRLGDRERTYKRVWEPDVERFFRQVFLSEVGNPGPSFSSISFHMEYG